MNALPDEWLRFAQEDHKTAQALFKEEIWSHVCFHAQQAVEKGLKALIECRKEVPKIHDLLELANESQKCGFDIGQFRPYFNYLNQFYTSTRYPFLTAVLPDGIPGSKEAEEALSQVVPFLNFVKIKLDLEK